MKLNRSEQARINGAKSHGPTTPEGKAISSRNAIKHGLTGGPGILLINENEDEFQTIRARWHNQLHPETGAENSLVDRIAAADWRLERIVAMETTLLGYEVDARARGLFQTWPSIDETGLLALAFRDATNDTTAFDLLRRYETMLDRSIARNVKLFYELQERRKAAAVIDRKPASPQPAAPTRTLRNEPELVGFACENRENGPPTASRKAA